MSKIKEKLTTIGLYKETKEQLDKLKLCEDETYNSLFIRIIPKLKELDCITLGASK